MDGREILTRQKVDLSGYWKFRADPEEKGLASKWYQGLPEPTDLIWVPGNWNEQVTRYNWYEGTAWYQRDFYLPDWDEKSVELCFEGVLSSAVVWLNGEKIGQYQGGYLTFRLRLEHLRKGEPEALIPLLLEAGITCLWPLEQASGMDPVRLRQKFGKALALAGGIDKRELAKDKKAIEKELYSKIPPLLESSGYIPHLDHTFSPEISYENFRYYLELKTKLIAGRF